MAGAGVVGQAMKRVLRIKFPQRRLSSTADGQRGEVEKIYFTDLRKSTSVCWGGKVSLLPKRTPLSAGEMEAVLLGGCF